MPVIYDDSKKIFHLQSGNASYVMQVVKDKYLAHLYWGKRLSAYHGSRAIIWKDRGFAPNPDDKDRTFSLDTLPQEYPQTGNGDFRNCAYGIRQKNGSRISSLFYKGYEIQEGKPELEGLPASFAKKEEAQTLKIFLEDAVAGLEVCLLYTVWHDRDVITRSVQFKNHSDSEIILTKMLSMSLDIRESEFDVMTLYGAHNNERNIDRRPLTSGTVQIESLRGTSSPHQSPFMALLRKETNEDYGEVFAANFVYSGNFTASAQVDPYRNTRFQMGMNPWNGEWVLKPEKTFQTPEVVMVYSDRGLGQMSRTFYHFYQECLIRSKFAREPRPILVNNWEATFFDFDEAKLLKLADKAQEAGIELFVLDDGWFGHRDADNSSLGDWFVDRRKLPHGLSELAKEIHKRGMKFGLWFEPEMTNKDSDLYRAHPDWILHTPGRNASHGRYQYVLDFSRKEVVEYIYEMMAKILSEAKVSYIKWDMNRSITECYSVALPADRQGEVFHRYILGVYDLYERLTSEFPEVLFESCSSGGGRFDPGMLYYAPQGWTSDDSDAIERLKIQYGTSLCYPISSMGSHVSVIPNHQVFRKTPLHTRANVAYFGTFGYELDLNSLKEEEIAEVKEQIIFMKKYRKLFQFGDFYRLKSPFEGNETIWMVVSEDKKTAIVGYYRTLNGVNQAYSRIKLQGLDPDMLYENILNKTENYGDELMNFGLITTDVTAGEVPGDATPCTDFESRIYIFKAKEK